MFSVCPFSSYSNHRRDLCYILIASHTECQKPAKVSCAPWCHFHSWKKRENELLCYCFKACFFSYSEVYCSLKYPEALKVKQQHYSSETSTLLNMKILHDNFREKLEMVEINKYTLSWAMSCEELQKTNQKHGHAHRVNSMLFYVQLLH